MLDSVYSLLVLDGGEYLNKILQGSFTTHAQRDLIRVTCGLILKPTHCISGLSGQLETLLPQVEDLIAKAMVLLTHVVTMLRVNEYTS
jgi:hypothetical protein